MASHGSFGTVAPRVASGTIVVMSFDEPTIVKREVPNPAYEDLEELLANVQQAKRYYSDDLDRPAGLMGEGVWTGPTAATTFATELEGRKTDLPGYFEQLADAVRERMTEVPKTRIVETKVW